MANALTETFDDYLEAQAAVAGQGRLVLEDFIGDIVYGFKPPRPSELRLSDLVIYAGRNHSQDCLDELLDCIYKLAQKSYQKQNEKYFRDWIFQFYLAYYSFGPYTEDKEFKILPDISRRIHWLSDMLTIDLDLYEKSAEKVKKVTPYAIAYLRLCLWMLKTAGERCDQLAFDSISEHIVKSLSLEDEPEDAKTTLDFYLTLRDSAPHQEFLIEYDHLCDYKNLVYVISGAWLIHKVKANERQSEKVNPFLEKLIANGPNFRALLDLYAMPGMKDRTSHDNHFDFEHWDWSNSYYSQTREGTDFERWIMPFYRFLILKKAVESDVSTIKLQNIRQTEWANHESLKEFLGAIANANYNIPTEYQSFTWTLSASQLQEAKDHINRILSAWSSQSDTRLSDD